jgi:hypothetical protein
MDHEIQDASIQLSLRSQKLPCSKRCFLFVLKGEMIPMVMNNVKNLFVKSMHFVDKKSARGIAALPGCVAIAHRSVVKSTWNRIAVSGID